ncbi:MAG TPA: LuxR C-terminal-related transcriptional regulator, partial [Solirubrobacteraceae bacterium]|nr:LuxR C-terminal-related transcriptional regulator [Solirubrobacteraceae bacterium]
MPRPRLAALQRTAQGSRLVLISAPAGYGKSTLIAQWSDLDPRGSCSVQLGHGDNDPVVLLPRLVAALERTGPVDRELLAELSRPAPRIDAVALPLLAAELERRDPLVVVLDDVQALTAEKSRAILALLIDRLGPGSQLVLVTRGDPGVSLGRLRADGDLVEFGTAALALDTQETREVAASGGLELSEEEAEALRARTEGWAAAVVLATLSLRGHEDAGVRAARLSGDQVQIADYLLEEVLERQPEHLKRFLLGTSILERMSAPLCDAVLGTSDAAASLEVLARSNAFVIPMDDRRRWYRYHHLFRDLLRAELGRRNPELLGTYRRRAADWCEQHGPPGEAFIYAHESGDLAQAGRIALAHRGEFAMRGQSESVRLWLERCSDEEIESDPQLSLAAGWVFFYAGDAARAKRFMAAAERGPLDEASPDGASSLRSSLASLRTIIAPDGIPGMLRDAEFTYAAEKAAGTRWHASGCRAMGLAYVLLGRPREAITVLREALTLLGEQPELAHVRVTCLAYLVFAAAELGNRRDAQRWAVEATWLVAEAHLDESAGATAAYAAGALVHQQRGDYTEAARQLESVRRLRLHLRAVPWVDADLALRCADISLELGDHGGALEFERVACDALQGYPDAGTLPARLRSLEGRIRRGEDYGLTSAELRVLSFLPTHFSLQEIADRLFLSRATVKTHVASIYDKLGVPGRSEAVEIIGQSGLGSADAK